MLRDGVCSPVALCIILAREFAVSGLRMVAAGAKDGKVIAANMSVSYTHLDVYKRQDYTSSQPEKSFGLLDEETNCYIELPAEWEGNLKLTDSEEFDGAVELRTVDEDQLVLTVRLARTSANSTGWTRLGVVASRQVQARMGPDVLLSDTHYRLSTALYLLN